MTIQLTEAQKASLFKTLATKTLTQTGLVYGFDKHYKSMKSLKTAVYKIYNQVRATPSIYGISNDTVELVVDNVSNRSVSAESRKESESLREEMELKTSDIKGMIIHGRNTAMALVNKKLEYLERHPKALKDTSITQLGTLFGIVFDKAQIIQGQATEHVALMGKIDKDLKPVDAIDMVLKMREVENSK